MVVKLSHWMARNPRLVLGSLLAVVSLCGPLDAVKAKASPALPGISYAAPGLATSFYAGYWDGDENFFPTHTPLFTRTVNAINFSDAAYNGSGAGNALNPWGFDGTALASEEYFTVKWEGSLVVDTPGNYTFSALSDDAFKLYINNNSIISNPFPHSPAVDNGTADLGTGLNSLKVYYGERWGLSVAQLRWKATGAADDAYALITTDGTPVPGPLALLGLGAACGISRRLRRRLSAAEAASGHTIR